MKSWRDLHSPWGRRLHFDPAEFEAMMDELRSRAGDCFSAGQGVDVDAVILRSFRTEADYVDLPEGVLGRTCFRADGSVAIEISRGLADLAEHDEIARRRLRATLGHECGHVACHCSLFARDVDTLSLFPEPNDGNEREPQMLCREEHVGTRYDGKWWEYQANQCMATLLLPRKLFSNSVTQTLSTWRVDSFLSAVKKGLAKEMIRKLANEYDVSQSATLYRLEALGFLPQIPQMRLQFSD